MSSRTRIKTRDGVLIDEVYQSPVDRYEVRFRMLFLLIVLVLAALIIGYVIWSVTADRPVTYSNITEHFKYGSIGSEPGGPLLSPVGGVLPILGLQGPARHLSRQTARGIRCSRVYL